MTSLFGGRTFTISKAIKQQRQTKLGILKDKFTQIREEAKQFMSYF